MAVAQLKPLGEAQIIVDISFDATASFFPPLPKACPQLHFRFKDLA